MTANRSGGNRTVADMDGVERRLAVEAYLSGAEPVVEVARRFRINRGSLIRLVRAAGKEVRPRQELQDMTGLRFGRLTVVAKVPHRRHLSQWLCRCDCGNESNVVRAPLLAGRVVSCGCWKLENVLIGSPSERRGIR